MASVATFALLRSVPHIAVLCKVADHSAARYVAKNRPPAAGTRTPPLGSDKWLGSEGL